MVQIHRKKVDLTNEFLILAYMVMDKDVLDSAHLKYKSKQLKTRHFSVHLRPIFRWLISYQGIHHKPPKKTIQKIFEKRKRRLAPEAREIVEECLGRLAEEFADLQYPNTDPDYIRKEILPDFIREREIRGKIEIAQNKIDQGAFKDAESVIAEYASVIEEDEDESLGTIIPYTKEDIIASKIDQSSEEAFRFTGDLHNLIGPLGKTWLVAITGIEKSGKSFFLQEMAFQAALYQKKKVLIINLELSESLVRSRAKMRLSLTTHKKDAGRILSPILDCENNQYGICQIKKQMPNKQGLFANNIDVIQYFDQKKWIVCTECKDTHIRPRTIATKKFIPTIWFKQTRIKEMTDRRVMQAIKDNYLSKLTNLRIKCFPRYSVRFDEVYNYIRRYVDKTGWKPDIIGFDYLDILAMENDNLQPRVDIDIKWKKASKLAGEMNCLVITPDQATKTGRTQYALDQMSTSETKTKDSHLDVRIAINQTDEEKELSIARLNVLFHRHAKFNIMHEVLVTQRLETAEPLSDNTRIFHRGKKYNVTMV